MNRILHVVCVAGALIAALAAPGYAGESEWEQDWTVLTLASDGTWGVASDSIIDRAIAVALRDCRAKSKVSNDCGGRFSTIRAGWTLAMQCGTETIIAAEQRLADAESAAHDREIELRTVYRRAMPSCARIVAISPRGIVEIAGRP